MIFLSTFTFERNFDSFAFIHTTGWGGHKCLSYFVLDHLIIPPLVFFIMSSKETSTYTLAKSVNHPCSKIAKNWKPSITPFSWNHDNGVMLGFQILHLTYSTRKHYGYFFRLFMCFLVFYLFIFLKIWPYTCVPPHRWFITNKTMVGFMHRNSLAKGITRPYIFYSYAIVLLLTSLVCQYRNIISASLNKFNAIWVFSKWPY